MIVKKKTLVLVATIMLAACNSNKSGAEKAVRETLKDPESARFGEFYYNSKTGWACLTTNAKNGMGGYTGDKQVRLKHDKDGWSSVGEAEETAADCKQYFADKP